MRTICLVIQTRLIVVLIAHVRAQLPKGDGTRRGHVERIDPMRHRNAHGPVTARDGLAPRPAPSVPIKIASRSISCSAGSSSETESSVNAMAAQENPGIVQRSQAIVRPYARLACQYRVHGT